MIFRGGMGGLLKIFQTGDLVSRLIQMSWL